MIENARRQRGANSKKKSNTVYTTRVTALRTQPTRRGWV